MIRLCAALALLLAAPALFNPAWAEGRPFTDDLGRQVTIPELPQRVVSTDDVFVTVPLLEMGAALAGSQGRPSRKGPPFLRSSKVLTGLGFDNTEMAFLGADPVDVEAIVAAHPDLIITMTTRAIPPEQLQQIAPTVVLDPTRRSPRDLYRVFAELTGRLAEAERMEAQYQAGLGLIRVLLGDRRLTVSLFDGTEQGKIAVHHTYGAMGEVIREIGLAQPPLFDRIPSMQNLELSPEVLPELDAAMIIGTYRDDRQDSPDRAKAALAAIYPDYCRVLSACAAGRMYFFPRDIARSNTYAARMMVIAFLLAVLPGALDAQAKAATE